MTTPTDTMIGADKIARNFGFFAIPDPSNPDVMTFWRRDRADNKSRKGSYITPWPSRKSYGPTVPPELEANPLTWAVTVCWPWNKALRSALVSDMDGCAARFSILTGHCCSCGEPSDIQGICTKCRARVPAEAIHRIDAAITRQQEGP